MPKLITCIPYKEKNIISSAIRLPQILFDEAGVFVIPFQITQPNFITNKKITAKSQRSIYCKYKI